MKSVSSISVSDIVATKLVTNSEKKVKRKEKYGKVFLVVLYYKSGDGRLLNQRRKEGETMMKVLLASCDLVLVVPKVESKCRCNRERKLLRQVSVYGMGG